MTATAVERFVTGGPKCAKSTPDNVFLRACAERLHELGPLQASVAEKFAFCVFRVIVMVG
jgi:hypothetical protein